MKIQMALGHNLLNPEIRLKKKKDLGLKEITDLNEVGGLTREEYSPQNQKKVVKKKSGLCLYQV